MCEDTSELLAPSDIDGEKRGLVDGFGGMSRAILQPHNALKLRLVVGLLLFAFVAPDSSYGGEPGTDEYPHVESALVSTTGIVRARQTAFQLWRHGFLTGPGDLKIYKDLDPQVRGGPGSMIEVWETQPDLRGAQTLRLRVPYEWKVSVGGMPSRSHDLAWLEHRKQLWLFTCECVRKKVEIKAYCIDLDKTIESEAKMGASRHWPRAEWPKVPAATEGHAWRSNREQAYSQMTAVVNGTSQVVLALRARGGQVQWVSFDPLARQPEGRWKVGMEVR